MKKRDKIKGILPYLVIPMYYFLFKYIVGGADVSTLAYCIAVSVIGFASYFSISLLEEGIDMFDKKMNNDLEEEGE